MEQKEFNKRCEKVFDIAENEQCYGITVDPSGQVVIKMSQDDLIFDYLPDMSERPQALDYLLGRRNDFND